jgi:hypothetical protein
MNLGARLLTAVGSVNVFGYTTEVEATSGDAFDVYLQLIDRDQLKADAGFTPSGQRYMPAVGATLQVTMPNLDSSKVVTRMATQPFAQDASIWKFSVLSTDPLDSTASLKLVLNESGVIRTAFLQAVLLLDGIQEMC